MLGYDGSGVVLRRMEMEDDAPAHLAANLLIAQIFKQSLAVDQPQCCLFEQGRLRTLEAGVRDLEHQSRMFALPGSKRRRAIQEPARDQLFIGIVAVKRAMHAISRFAHETLVTYGIPVHPIAPLNYSSPCAHSGLAPCSGSGFT
jgi:hypothetical protein